MGKTFMIRCNKEDKQTIRRLMAAYNEKKEIGIVRAGLNLLMAVARDEADNLQAEVIKVKR